MRTHLMPVSKQQVALAQDGSGMSLVGIIQFIIALLTALEALFERKAADST